MTHPTASRAAKLQVVEFTSPWKPLGERSPNKQHKKEAVLRAATRMFNEKGFHATSLDEIAMVLNVTKPTVYYYFKSKDDILYESVLLGLQLITDGINRVKMRGGRAFDQLQACMDVYANIVMEDFGRCVVSVGENPLPESQRREIRQIKSEVDLVIRHLIDDCVEEGSIRKCNSKMAGFLLAGGLGSIARWYAEGGELSSEEVSVIIRDYLLNGLVSNNL
jgi:AcrR family transcriptional regulator